MRKKVNGNFFTLLYKLKWVQVTVKNVKDKIMKLFVVLSEKYIYELGMAKQLTQKHKQNKTLTMYNDYINCFFIKILQK